MFSIVNSIAEIKPVASVKNEIDDRDESFLTSVLGVFEQTTLSSKNQNAPCFK